MVSPISSGHIDPSKIPLNNQTGHLAAQISQQMKNFHALALGGTQFTDPITGKVDGPFPHDAVPQDVVENFCKFFGNVETQLKPLIPQLGGNHQKAITDFLGQVNGITSFLMGTKGDVHGFDKLFNGDYQDAKTEMYQVFGTDAFPHPS